MTATDHPAVNADTIAEARKLLAERAAARGEDLSKWGGLPPRLHPTAAWLADQAQAQAAEAGGRVLTDQDWKWYVGDGESYHAPCDTREEAVRRAIEHGGAHICEARTAPPLMLSEQFDAQRFVDQANDDLCDLCDPFEGGVIFEPYGAQIYALQGYVRAAIDKWQHDHGLADAFRQWAFAEVRKTEFIPADKEPPE